VNALGIRHRRLKLRSGIREKLEIRDQREVGDQGSERLKIREKRVKDWGLES